MELSKCGGEMISGGDWCLVFGDRVTKLLGTPTPGHPHILGGTTESPFSTGPAFNLYLTLSHYTSTAC